MLPYKALIFDCDGVMFDTRETNRAYYNHVLESMGRPAMTDAQFAFCHMHTVYQSLEHLFPEEADRVLAREVLKTIDYLPFLDSMILEPHLKPLISTVKPRVKTAICTNRTTTMDRVMKRFDLSPYFDMVVTAYDVANPKPHPEPLLMIADAFGIPAAKALYVGDSRVDEQAAAGAGMPFAAYLNNDLNADYHLKDLSGLYPVFGIQQTE